MAKSGSSSSVVDRDSSRSAGTAAQLVRAAIEALQTDGYAGASARSIADRAGLNQGLVFYHFGSVANLLLAALDSVSEQRLAKYGSAVEQVGSPSELVDVAMDIFREDLDAGYVAVLVEMIAGASATPGLGPRSRPVSDRGSPSPSTRSSTHRGGLATRRRSCRRATWPTGSWRCTWVSRC